MSQVNKVVYPLVTLEAGFSLGYGVVMVWEDKIDASSVKVYFLSEHGACHHRAFDVPSGPALPPRTIPLGLLRFATLPKRKVSGVTLVSFDSE